MLPKARVDVAPHCRPATLFGYPDAEAEAGMLARPRVARQGARARAGGRSRRDRRGGRDRAPRARLAGALRDYIVALLRRTREDERVELGDLAARRPDAAAGGQGARARARPRPRAARRRPGARRSGPLPPHHARPRGGGRAALGDRRATPSPPFRLYRPHEVGTRMCRAGPAAVGRRGHVRRRAAVRHRRRAAAARRGRGGRGSEPAAWARSSRARSACAR